MVMTQQPIANTLGIPREGATEGALNVHRAGLIEYSGGRIQVLDRAGLERRTCACLLLRGRSVVPSRKRQFAAESNRSCRRQSILEPNW
jgi:hypothetical protein